MLLLFQHAFPFLKMLHQKVTQCIQSFDSFNAYEIELIAANLGLPWLCDLFAKGKKVFYKELWQKLLRK